MIKTTLLANSGGVGGSETIDLNGISNYIVVYKVMYAGNLYGVKVRSAHYNSTAYNLAMSVKPGSGNQPLGVARFNIWGELTWARYYYTGSSTYYQDMGPCCTDSSGNVYAWNTNQTGSSTYGIQLNKFTSGSSAFTSSAAWMLSKSAGGGYAVSFGGLDIDTTNNYMYASYVNYYSWYNVYITKINTSSGLKVWSKIFNYYANCSYIAQTVDYTNDRVFILISTSYPTSYINFLSCVSGADGALLNQCKINSESFGIWNTSYVRLFVRGNYLYIYGQSNDVYSALLKIDITNAASSGDYSIAWKLKVLPINGSTIEPRALYVDTSNNVYIGGAVTNGSNKDGYIIKLDSSGNKVFERSFTGNTAGDDSVISIAMDQVGKLLVTGTIASLDTTFVARIPSDGSGQVSDPKSVNYVTSNILSITTHPTNITFTNGVLNGLSYQDKDDLTLSTGIGHTKGAELYGIS